MQIDTMTLLKNETCFKKQIMHVKGTKIETKVSCFKTQIYGRLVLASLPI